MSTAKYEKHQKSKYAKYLMRDPENGELLLSANSEKEFLKKREEFLNYTEQKLAIPKSRR